MKHAKSMLATAAAIAFMMASAASAGVTTYSDRSTFELATGATTVEDFTSSYHLPLTAGTLNSSTSENVASGSPITPGTILPGVTYSTPDLKTYSFNIDAGAGFTGGFLDDIAGPEVLTITFDRPQAAFGFDTNYFMGAFQVTAASTSGLFYTADFPSVGSNTLEFFGFQSASDDIKYVTIAGDDAGGDPTGVGFAIDNFTYNGTGVSGAPEPTTWTLMLLGMGGVGLVLRRSKKTLCSRSADWAAAISG